MSYLGMKALLDWVNSVKLSEEQQQIDSLRDGTVLLKLVYRLKKESTYNISDSVEERFNIISTFLERDCRFCPSKGTTISWDSIQNGRNLNVEISKVLILLLYHDMMSERLTLNMLDSEVEKQLAFITDSFVLESDGMVYLSDHLDQYLVKKRLPYTKPLESTSSSNMSTSSPFSISDESPIFRRSTKVAFVDLETVASSSVSQSPLIDIMNTPKFQMRQMQRTLIKEREYKDTVERELANMLTLVAQREGLISQLQYRNEKLKEENANQEHASREQISELETKNDMLRVRLDEILIENKELKSSSALMERKVDELAEENGALSSRVRVLCSQLASCEEKVNRMTQRHFSIEEDWESKSSQLISELKEATAQKELLTEQIQILQGKISCLEEEMSKATKEEEGENMGPVMERSLNTEILSLRNELDCTLSSLKEAEIEIKNCNLKMAEYQQQISTLQQHNAAFEQEIFTLKEENRESRELLRHTEERVASLETELEQAEELHEEIKEVKEQVESLRSSLRAAEESLRSKEEQFAEQQLQSCQHLEALQIEVNRLKQEIQTKEHEADLLKSDHCKETEVLSEEIKALKNQVQSLMESLKTATEERQIHENLLAQKDMEMSQVKDSFKSKIEISEQEIRRLGEEIQTKEDQLVSLKEESSSHSDELQQEIKTLSQRLKAKEQELDDTQQESSQKMNSFEQQLLSVNMELTQVKETLAANQRMKEAVQELHVSSLKQKEVVVQEKETLLVRIHQAETDRKALEKRVETLIAEKDRLARANEAMERENKTSCKLELVLQKELEILKREREQLLMEREKAEETELAMRDLEKRLAARSEAAEHYKTQMEKAVSHYNNKKQLLQKSEEETAELRRALEVKNHEVNAITMDKRLLQADLDKVQTNEKKLLSTVASLETQLAYADQTLRAQNRIHGSEAGSSKESFYLAVPTIRSGVSTRSQMKRSMSCDSLGESSLEDTLNSTRKLSAPEESSTPLVRSSERLAAKRKGPQSESQESLYFTPINTRQTRRGSLSSDTVLESAQKNPASSAKRRRTTQVVNITMSKKMPGSSEESETLGSGCSVAHSARSLSMEAFDTPHGKSSAASDQLIGLPGYRRSTIHSQTAGTFCVGAENEPDGGPDDWLRIAELQARNKACLPHLKSSYPVEFETRGTGGFVFTDEELRTGDPSDTIRRASMMPGQLQDSLVSHRQSLMFGQAGVGSQAHRMSLMPGQLPSKRPSQKSPRGSKQSSSTLSLPQTSPERKTRTSCFPRPLTPKSKNVSSSHLHAVLTPAERRQSTVFTIENTPKKNNYLKKKLTKLRGSARKSPTARPGSWKSPQSTSKGVKKASQANSRSAKSPGLTESARKVK
uniref:Nuclear mitotic apparatus protein 1 n=1 Tax=Nothobranchius furzeri TaxID=105023 RepID=A0A1A7ZJM1_NOTFU